MIFAAGFGTRMRPLTLTRPKPMIEVAGRMLIDRTLDLVQAIDPMRIIVNLHYKAAMLDTHLAGRNIVTITESPEILDTGGGLKNALPLIKGDTVVTSNSDAIWVGPNPFGHLLSAWDPARMDALLLCVPLENCVGRKGGGDFDLTEGAGLDRGNSLVFGGVHMIRTDAVARVSDKVFSLNKVWDHLHEQGRLCGALYPGRWCDIGTPDGIGLAEDLISEAADG